MKFDLYKDTKRYTFNVDGVTKLPYGQLYNEEFYSHFRICCVNFDTIDIVIGSLIETFEISENAYLPLNFDNTVMAIGLLCLQLDLLRIYNIKSTYCFGTQGIAISRKMFSENNVQALRDGTNNVMSGWWIYDADDHSTDFSNFDVITVSEFVNKYPKLAKYLLLPENTRFFSRTETIILDRNNK